MDQDRPPSAAAAGGERPPSRQLTPEPAQGQGSSTAVGSGSSQDVSADSSVANVVTNLTVAALRQMRLRSAKAAAQQDEDPAQQPAQAAASGGSDDADPDDQPGDEEDDAGLTSRSTSQPADDFDHDLGVSVHVL